MGQTVYVDLLFLINFSMDVLALYLTSRILGRRLRLGRMLLAGALGGVYACAALFLHAGSVAALLLDALVCVLLGAITFWERGGLLVPVLTFTAVSMSLGGVMTALFTLLNRLELPLDTQTGDGDGISVFLFAFLAAVSALLTLMGGRFFAKRSSVKNATLSIRIGGRSLRLSALVDSGNLLCEPVSGKPCVVAELSAFRSVLPEEFLEAARQKKYIYPADAGRMGVRGVCLIPAKTASGSGMLLAFRPEGITVDAGKGAREVDAYVALCELGGSAMGQEALLPGVLVTG